MASPGSTDAGEPTVTLGPTAAGGGPDLEPDGYRSGPDLDPVLTAGPELAGPRVRERGGVGRDLGAAWSTWRPAVLVAAGGTVLLRLVTEWIALVSAYGVKFPHLVARHPSVLVDVWAQWDTSYYVSIARYGYAGRTLRPGQMSGSIAFGPVYPWCIRIVHAVTGLGWVAAAELVSLVATFVGLALLYRLAQWDGTGGLVGRGDARGRHRAARVGSPGRATGDDEQGRRLAGTTVMLLLAWPAAFFLLAPYPESITLALGAGAYLAARRRLWLLAGVLCAGTAMAKYYLALLVVPLAIEVWQSQRQRPARTGVGRHAGGAETRPEEGGRRVGATDRRALVPRAWPWVAVVGPTVVAFVAWMVYQQAHVGDALAFERAQATVWHRHLAGPWSSLGHTVSDLVHWRFLDTNVASVVELFDFVTVVVLAIAAVYAYLRVRRSYGVLLGLAWCVFTFQTILMGEVREALALSPLWIALGVWATGHPWRERVLLVLFLPCSFYLIERFVTGAFAG